MTKKQTTTLFFICLATSLFTIDMGIVSVALIDIEGSFSTIKSVASWVITMFSISSAIGIISLASLCRIFGRKNVYSISILGFTICSTLCGISGSIETLLFFRLLQGFFGAGLVALSQAIVVDTFPASERSKAISAWTFGLLAGPVIGPLLGGYLIEYLNWRWIFFINLPIGLFAFFGIVLYLINDKKSLNIKINYFGFFLLSVTAASIQLILDRGEFEDWFNSKFILTLNIVSLFSFILFIFNSFSSKNPLFPLNLFRDNYYVGGIIFAFLFGFILIPPFILLPIFLAEIRGFPIYVIGSILSCSALGGMAITFFMSRVIDKIGNVLTMILGLSIYMISNIHVSFWTADISTSEIILNSLLRGVSISIFYVPLANITYTSLPNNLRTDGASLFQFLRTLGTGTSVAIFINLLNRYESFHYESIRNNLLYSKLRNLNFFENYYLMANEKKQLYYLVNHYAQINSIIDDFFLLGIIPLIFFPFFLLFLKKKS